MNVVGKIYTNVIVNEKECVKELYKTLGLINESGNVCVEFKDGKVYTVVYTYDLREDYVNYVLLYDNEFDYNVAKQLVDAYEEYMKCFDYEREKTEYSKVVAKSGIIKKLTKDY